MKIERFEVAGLAQYSYVVSCGNSALVIDPMRDVDRYTAYLVRHGLKLKYVLETHIHADYASGAAALAETTGAELCLSGYDAGELLSATMPHRDVRDGVSLVVGNVRLQALHTPGHTPEHLSFLLYDRLRSDTLPLAMFSGDFLFVGSLGRPDLLGETAKLGLAHELYRSVTERMAGLPDGLQVYPGHGAGSLCGSGMSDRPETTLGFERATNPYFGYTEAEFVERILGSVPPMPAYYPRMKALNGLGAVAVPPVPGGVGLGVAEVARLLEQGAMVLDLRRAAEFGAGHVPGAVNIGAGANLPLWAGWVLDATQPLVLVTEDGMDDEESRRALVRVGLDGVVGYLAGGMAAWLAVGQSVATTTQRTVEQVAEAVDRWLVLDVRNAAERAGGGIAGAVEVALGDLDDAMKALPDDREIVVVCGTGYRSSIAASLLQREGFERVSSMAGGMAAWTGMGLPVG